MADKASRYQGDFLAWNGGALLIGSSAGPPIAPHSHYAIQIAIGAPAGLRMQFGRNGAWAECAGGIVPSRTTHTIDVSDCEWSAVMFVEPETLRGRALTARLHGNHELLAPERCAAFLSAMEKAWQVDRDADAVRSVCSSFIGELARTAELQVSDARVLRAVEYIGERTDHAVTLEEVAGLVHLSPSRFRHLFVAQTGMPLRTYVLWRRLLSVWDRLMEGETLSAAAHSAGFADSAHLSRTARDMFGLPPSALQMVGPLSEAGRTPRRHFG
jgi:AraC family transcriptional regulator